MSNSEDPPYQEEALAGSSGAPIVNRQACVRQETPRPVFMPETFTGTGREWSDWAGQFELAADVNNWDESLKLKFMSLLSGRAREVYSGLAMEARNSYVLFKEAMGRCLEPCDSDDWNRVSFLS